MTYPSGDGRGGFFIFIDGCKRELTYNSFNEFDFLFLNWVGPFLVAWPAGKLCGSGRPALVDLLSPLDQSQSRGCARSEQSDSASIVAQRCFLKVIGK